MLYRAAEGEPSKRIAKGPKGKVRVSGARSRSGVHGLHPSGAAITWRNGRGPDRRAWNVRGCSDNPADQFLTEPDAALQAGARFSQFFRGSDVNLGEVRRLAPLPETVAELCAVAASLGGGEQALVLGADATKETVELLSREGKLAAARVVHFATHGLVAGEIEGLAEPSLVLTPPAEAGDGKGPTEENGLLTASEIAQLKLDADWVVLSACNTASGDAQGAQALSGLARAFFYAGARSLLVSHWAVNSQAAVKLIIGTFEELASDPSIGRAEGLRRAILALIENGAMNETHPTYWAPFVLVGDGSSTL